VAELLDLGFDRAPKTPRRTAPAASLVAKAAPNVTPAAVPAPRPGTEVAAGPSLLQRGVAAVGSALAPAAAQAAEPQAFASVTPFYDTPPAPKPGGELRVTVLPTPRGGWAAAGATSPERRPQGENWTVRLGAFPDAETAVAELASAALGAMPELAEAGREVAIADAGGASLFQARLTGLSPEVAKTACIRIRHAGGACEAGPSLMR
jgi:hypothetical protein